MDRLPELSVRADGCTLSATEDDNHSVARSKLMGFSIEPVLTGSRCCMRLYQACIYTSAQLLPVVTDQGKGGLPVQLSAAYSYSMGSSVGRTEDAQFLEKYLKNIYCHYYHF